MCLRLRPVTLASTVLALSACSVSQFESEPITVRAEHGYVVCQLYKPGLVIFDKAVSVYGRIESAEADLICRAEGRARQMRGKDLSSGSGDAVENNGSPLL